MEKIKKGFTLLELLVVISIIGILIAIGTVAYSSAQKRGRDARRKGDLKAIQNAMEECYALDTDYPTSLTGGAALTCAGEDIMDSVPDDPKDGTDYIEVTLTASEYQICADLEGDGTWDGTNQDYCISNLQ